MKEIEIIAEECNSTKICSRHYEDYQLKHYSTHKTLKNKNDLPLRMMPEAASNHVCIFIKTKNLSNSHETFAVFRQTNGVFFSQLAK